jgi:hypothetical protein
MNERKSIETLEIGPCLIKAVVSATSRSFQAETGFHIYWEKSPAEIHIIDGDGEKIFYLSDGKVSGSE